MKLEVILNVAQSLGDLLKKNLQRLDLQWNDKEKAYTGYAYYDNGVTFEICEEGGFWRS